ncbi:MAG: ABC transporter permease [Thaumarchaeota archaeon]|nr:ABC transporter permease [Nitrososphaerota archaeon]
MRLTDVMKFGINALKNRKLRAILTIIGIAMGPATITALVAATGGFANQATSQFNKLGTGTILVTPAGRGVTLQVDDQVILSKLDGVKLALPFFRIQATVRSVSQTSQASIIAIETNQLQELFPGIKINQGSLPNDGEYTAAAVGYNIAHPPGGVSPELNLNQIISFSYQTNVQRQVTTQTRSLAIKAVLDQFGQGLFLNPDDTIFVTLASGRLFSRTTNYAGIYLVAKTPDDVTNIVEQINGLYGNDVRTITVSSILSTVQSVTAGVTNLLGSVAAVSVVVAFTGIMTTMFTSVNERVREIGILKALGTSKRGIMFIFLAEAISTGIIGGLVGASMGSLISYFVASTLFAGGLRFGGPVGGPGGGPRPPGAGAAAPAASITPAITPELFLGAFLLAIGVSALAGILPAWKASRLTPVEALRKE